MNLSSVACGAAILVLGWAPQALGQPIPSPPGHPAPLPVANKIDQSRLRGKPLSNELLDKVARTVQHNEKLLGADAIDFCHRVAPDRRSDCLSEVRQLTLTELDGVIEVTGNSELDQGGKEWPNTDDLSNFRRVQLSVSLRKGARTAPHDIDLVVFESKHGATAETCVFPLEHWAWSEMHRPERFAHAPIGYCDKGATTLAQYLLERAPSAKPSVLRFVSEAEANAWKSRAAERIQWKSPYTSGHPWAKYFLLDSHRWWRGGNPKQPNPAYGWAVRIPNLPLGEIAQQEKEGHLYLDIFEDAAQIELTTLTRPGIDFLLAKRPEVLVDTSAVGDNRPQLRPLAD